MAWIKSTWDELEVLPFTSVPLAEIREPEFIDTIEDLARADQDALTSDLAERLSAAPATAPAVCHLDTGVRQSHVLLHDSFDDRRPQHLRRRWDADFTTTGRSWPASACWARSTRAS